MFEFEGDTFLATAVVAVVREENKVFIVTTGYQGQFHYEYESKEEAMTKAGEAATAWRKAKDGQPI